jgi:hypothetical protein
MEQIKIIKANIPLSNLNRGHHIKVVPNTEEVNDMLKKQATKLNIKQPTPVKRVKKVSILPKVPSIPKSLGVITISKAAETPQPGKPGMGKAEIAAAIKSKALHRVPKEMASQVDAAAAQAKGWVVGPFGYYYSSQDYSQGGSIDGKEFAVTEADQQKMADLDSMIDFYLGQKGHDLDTLKQDWGNERVENFMAYHQGEFQRGQQHKESIRAQVQSMLDRKSLSSEAMAEFENLKTEQDINDWKIKHDVSETTATSVRTPEQQAEAQPKPGIPDSGPLGQDDMEGADQAREELLLEMQNVETDIDEALNIWYELARLENEFQFQMIKYAKASQPGEVLDMINNVRAYQQELLQLEPSISRDSSIKRTMRLIDTYQRLLEGEEVDPREDPEQNYSRRVEKGRTNLNDIITHGEFDPKYKTLAKVDKSDPFSLFPQMLNNYDEQVDVMNELDRLEGALREVESNDVDFSRSLERIGIAKDTIATAMEQSRKESEEVMEFTNKVIPDYEAGIEARIRAFQEDPAFKGKTLDQKKKVLKERVKARSKMLDEKGQALLDQFTNSEAYDPTHCYRILGVDKDGTVKYQDLTTNETQLGMAVCAASRVGKTFFMGSIHAMN